jgi:hypothetical protein
MPLHATDKRARSFKDLANQDLTFYVRPGGSDTADGLTPATAFATLKTALWEIEKDFMFGAYTIDITGCTLTEKLRFPQMRCGSYIHGDRDEVTDTTRPIDPLYWVMHRASVAIRAKMGTVSPFGTTEKLMTCSGMVDTTPRSQTFTFSGVTWAENQHVGRFIALMTDATTIDSTARLLPIFSNTTDSIVVPPGVFGYDPTGLTFAIVEPGATVELGGEIGRWVIDGTGGMVFSGIKFDLAGRDESLIATNCPHLLFEGCSFQSPAGWARSRIGGFGLVRFFYCTSSIPFRNVGGSAHFHYFTSTGETGFSSGMFSAGAPDSTDNLASPVPQQFTLNSVLMGVFGYIGDHHNAVSGLLYYNVHVKNYESQPSRAALFHAYRCRLVNYNVSAGSQNFESTELVDLVLCPGARVTVSNCTFEGMITCNDVSIAAGDYTGILEDTAKITLLISI